MLPDHVRPEAKAVEEYLAMVFGTGVDVSETNAAPLYAAYGGRYINDADELVAVCICDVAFAAYSACALSMIPAHVAEQMVGAGRLSATAQENFHEVMNLCSRLLISEHSAHLRLDGAPAGDALEALAHQFEDPAVAAFAVTIPEYGTGAMAFLLR